MSLLNKASLIQIPSGYKDGTLYSAKPTNGDGDFTFSRGSNLAATRVNSEGLIEKGRENLLLQSNQFNTTWGTTNASVTGGQTGYDGSNNAWLLQASGTFAYVGQTGLSVNGVTTASVYIKAGTTNWANFRIQASANNQIYVNVSNGTFGTVYANDLIDKSIEDVGNGWYRVSVVLNVSSLSGLFIYVADDDSSLNTTNETVFIQSAQLEQGLVATDYIETGASTAQAGILEDMPRLDYSGGATCPSCLLEPQRSNAIIDSEYFSGGWTKFGGSTIEVGYQSPEGLNNAVKATRGSNRTLMRSNNYATLSVNNVFSIYAKSGSINKISLDIGDEGETEFDLTDEWQRFDIVVNPSTYRFCDISMPNSSLSGDYFYIYGAMLETSASYPTSYIPTYGGASVTRSADNIPLLDLRTDGLLTGTDYTYVVNLIFNTGTATFSGFLNEVDSVGGYKGGLVWNGGLQYRTPVSGSNQYVTLDSVISKGDFSKLVIRCTGSLREFFYNGTKLGTSLNSDNAGTDTDGFRFYYNSATANFFSASYSQINVFPTALTDAECEQLTTI